MTHKSHISRFVGVVALTALAGCASGGGERHLSGELSEQRYFDENPSALDSDVYYDPFYNYRGTGEFRAERKLKPY